MKKISLEKIQSLLKKRKEILKELEMAEEQLKSIPKLPSFYTSISQLEKHEALKKDIIKQDKAICRQIERLNKHLSKTELSICKLIPEAAAVTKIEMKDGESPLWISKGRCTVMGFWGPYDKTYLRVEEDIFFRSFYRI